MVARFRGHDGGGEAIGMAAGIGEAVPPYKGGGNEFPGVFASLAFKAAMNRRTPKRAKSSARTV